MITEAMKVRRRFYKALVTAFYVVWPIFSLIIAVIAGLGMIISFIEGWRPLEGVYFAFVTGLTVGYGDYVPKHAVSRVIAIGIGFSGILLTAIFAAISVRALEEAVKERLSSHPER